MRHPGGYAAGPRLVSELPPPPPSVCVPAAGEAWWCECDWRDGPHVHFPNWDANPRYGVIVSALVDTATGLEVPRSRR